MKHKKPEEIDMRRLKQFNLSENNRLTYIYDYSNKRQCMEIVCVSLEIRIKDEWETILRYDNHHDGILHRHTLIAYKNTANIVDYNGTKRKGNFTKLLSWAIKDIQNNYLIYKRKFLNRNKPLLKGIEVDEY